MNELAEAIKLHQLDDVMLQKCIEDYKISIFSEVFTLREYCFIPTMKCSEAIKDFYYKLNPESQVFSFRFECYNNITDLKKYYLEGYDIMTICIEKNIPSTEIINHVDSIILFMDGMLKIITDLAKEEFSVSVLNEKAILTFNTEDAETNN